MDDSLLLNAAEVRARHVLAYVFRYGADFPLHIAGLISELARSLDLAEASLDRSLDSLVPIEQSIARIGGGRAALESLFPHLVAYVGEVLIERNGGSWYMLWRPDYAVWEPYVVTESGEFCDPFSHLYDQLHDCDRDASLLVAISRMIDEAGLQ
jgi:hypothetical protein